MKKNIFCVLLFLIITTTVAEGQSLDPFKKGYYFDKAGIKHEGLLRHKFSAHTFSEGPDNSIVFKENEESKKNQLTTDDISAFVIERDSFIVIKKFHINSSAHYNSDFVKVLQSGKINLYLHYTTVPGQYGGSIATTYLISRDNQSFTPISKRDFKIEYKKIFSGHPELISKIEQKQLNFNDFESIIRSYNEFMISKQD